MESSNPCVALSLWGTVPRVFSSKPSHRATRSAVPNRPEFSSLRGREAPSLAGPVPRHAGDCPSPCRGLSITISVPLLAGSVPRHFCPSPCGVCPSRFLVGSVPHAFVPHAFSLGLSLTLSRCGVCPSRFLVGSVPRVFPRTFPLAFRSHFVKRSAFFSRFSILRIAFHPMPARVKRTFRDFTFKSFSNHFQITFLFWLCGIISVSARGTASAPRRRTVPERRNQKKKEHHATKEPHLRP